MSQKTVIYQNNILNIYETRMFRLFVQSLFVLMFMCVRTQSLITYSGFCHRTHAMLRCRLHGMHRVSSYSVLFSALFLVHIVRTYMLYIVLWAQSFIS